MTHIEELIRRHDLLCCRRYRIEMDAILARWRRLGTTLEDNAQRIQELVAKLIQFEVRCRLRKIKRSILCSDNNSYYKCILDAVIVIDSCQRLTEYIPQELISLCIYQKLCFKIKPILNPSSLKQGKSRFLPCLIKNQG